jgi:hypothetical protein
MFQREGSPGFSSGIINGVIAGAVEDSCDGVVDRIRAHYDPGFVIESAVGPDCGFSIRVPASKLIDLLFVDDSGRELAKLVYNNSYLVQVESESGFFARLLLSKNDTVNLGRVVVAEENGIAIPEFDPLHQLDGDGDSLSDAVDENLSAVQLLNPVEGDIDEDGVDNSVDNCPFAANSSQSDVDGDGRGDACSISGTTLHGTLVYQVFREMLPEQVVELEEIIDDLGDFPLGIEITDGGVLVGPVPQKGNWVSVGDVWAMVDAEGEFTLENLPGGADRAQVFHDPEDETPLFGFPLVMLSTESPGEAVIEVEIPYPEPCGMDGASCPHHLDPDPQNVNGLGLAFDNDGFARSRGWVETAEEGNSPDNPNRCGDDYNRFSCCLDYDGPFGAGEEITGSDPVSQAAQYRVFLYSTCDEAVKANCCVNEAADPRYIRQQLWGKLGFKAKQKFKPRNCYQSHKFRNCQWIRYKTLDGLYASQVMPDVTALSPKYDELNNPQTGRLQQEEVQVTCGETKEVFVYNNACRNSTAITFYREHGGSMLLKAGAERPDRPLPDRRRVNARHYSDPSKSHVFTRTLEYTAPGTPSEGEKLDQVVAESAGMTRVIRFRVDCETTDDGGGSGTATVVDDQNDTLLGCNPGTPASSGANSIDIKTVSHLGDGMLLVETHGPLRDFYLGNESMGMPGAYSASILVRIKLKDGTLVEVVKEQHAGKEADPVLQPQGGEFQMMPEWSGENGLVMKLKRRNQSGGYDPVDLGGAMVEVRGFSIKDELLSPFTCDPVAPLNIP